MHGISSYPQIAAGALSGEGYSLAKEKEKEQQAPTRQMPGAESGEDASRSLSSFGVTQRDEPLPITLTGPLDESHYRYIIKEICNSGVSKELYRFLIHLRMNNDKAAEFVASPSVDCSSQCLEGFNYLMTNKISFTWGELADSIQRCTRNKAHAGKVKEKCAEKLGQYVQTHDQDEFMTHMNTVVTQWGMILRALKLPDAEVRKIKNEKSPINKLEEAMYYWFENGYQKGGEIHAPNVQIIVQAIYNCGKCATAKDLAKKLNLGWNPVSRY